MTPLAQLLIRRIAVTGPISVAEYMTECLLHPKHGYYTTRDPFGAAGDFTTASEISQMFGELIGLALAQAWIDQGRPDPFALAELGPGRGTLMADALRAAESVAGFAAAARVHLIEASPVLRARQKETLAQWPVQWHETVDHLPQMPHFLIANEFFDALPIRQFVRDDAGWRERQVGIDGEALVFGLGASAPMPALQHRQDDTQPGDLIETCGPAASIISEIATRIAANRGAALVIDYGGWRSLGDTLQAVRDHAPTDPIAAPGEADLTAHVDFEALARAAEGVSVSQMTEQGVFLDCLGISSRAETLARNLSGAALQSHLTAHRRLTDSNEMGSLFKVLGFTPVGSPPLAGLAP